MKEYILNLINSALSDTQLPNSNVNYDISFLKEIIDKVSNNKDYFYEFILDLNGDLIKEIISRIDPEERRESFLASIIYLKNLLEIDKKEEVKIPLSENQEAILYELLELIKQIADSDDNITNESLKGAKKNQKKLKKLLDKFNNDELLSVDDYNLVESLIKEYERENVNKVLNDVMDYLNEYNYPKLPEFIEQESPVQEIASQEEETTEDKEELVAEEIITNESSESSETDFEEEKTDELTEEISDEPTQDALPESSEDVFEEEKTDELAEEISDESTQDDLPESSETDFDEAKTDELISNEENDNKNIIDFDIFNPQSFIFDDTVPEKRKRKSKKRKIESNDEKTVEITETKPAEISIFEELGVDRENLNSYCSNLVENGINEGAMLFYRENLKDRFNKENINGIMSVLCLSDKETLEEIFAYFKEINISDETINDLLNRATHIFLTKNRGLFRDNVLIALSYNDDLNYLIKNNITFFYNSPEYNKNKVNLLEMNGININLLFKNKCQLLAIGIDKLLKNISALKNYNLELNNEDYDSLSIISASNLNIMLDVFIETGFSTYLFSDGLKNVRSLIIKRIFYAFKNGLNVWNETGNTIKNEEYDNWISKERVALSSDEINALISSNSLLELIEETKRPYNDDSENAMIKRKYELRFDNIIISRLKTYSIFKVLTDHGVDEKEALVYALTYNVNLSLDEYCLIKNEIFGK